jgi:hypothetical protein
MNDQHPQREARRSEWHGKGPSMYSDPDRESDIDPEPLDPLPALLMLPCSSCANQAQVRLLDWERRLTEKELAGTVPPERRRCVNCRGKSPPGTR